MRLAAAVSTVLLVAACGGSPRSIGSGVQPAESAKEVHRDAVAALARPLIDAQITTGLVVGLYDAGKLEIYGFGKGPDGAPPTGTTLFELGTVTQVYTDLVFADAIQRREVALDTELSDLLPPGVTAPTAPAGPNARNARITLGMLAVHTSGLPRLPPSLERRPGTQAGYASYSEDRLYADLIHANLVAAPGAQILASTFGAGVLGFVLGKKLGGGLVPVVQQRVLAPLGLTNTFFTVPAAASRRRQLGTNLDLAPVPLGTWGALAGAGGLISTARDQLALIDAELDAASGSKQPLRAAMRLTHEDQIPGQAGANEGLGWQIDALGRYWHNGGTGGFRAFVGFDPKVRRGVVILSSSAVSLVDHLALDLYKVLAGEAVAPVTPPPVEQLRAYTGTYELGQFELAFAIKDGRMYITGQGEAPLRLIPISDHEMWFEEQQAVVVFEKEDGKVARAVFVVGPQRIVAPRVRD